MARKYPRWRTLQHIRQQAESQDGELRESMPTGQQFFARRVMNDAAPFAQDNLATEETESSFFAEADSATEELRVSMPMKQHIFAQRVVSNALPFAQAKFAIEESISSPLGTDITEFLSYQAPILPAGEYLATATQSVTDPESKNVVKLISKQPFRVHGPRFSLQPDVVHQVYPPTGTSEHNNVLPHMVFEDPHLPWEQKIPGEATGKTRVPWLALLVFEESDLKLDPAHAKPVGKGGLLPNPQQGMQDETVQQDSVMFAVRTTVGDWVDLGAKRKTATDDLPKLQLPLRKDGKEDRRDIEDDELAQPIECIYVRQQQIDSLFSSIESDGSVKPVQQDQVPDMSRYAYLAHVRRNASVTHSADNDEHYSVVIAHQTGPVKSPEPKPLIVHLVSLEGVKDNIKLNPTSGAESGLVGLISLHSWTYTSLPPDGVNLIDSLRKIGAELQDAPEGKGDCWLRAPRAKIEALRENEKANPAISQKLAQRLEDGFMIQRYLLQTGEETISFFRGPLTPTYVKPITESWWPMQSNFSTDYQILDPNLGIMDVSYSAAWQLGKVLGLASQQFAAAIVRLRSSVTIEAKATTESRYHNVNMDITQVMSGLASGVSQMNVLAEDPDIQIKRVGGQRGTVIGSYKPGAKLQPAANYTNHRRKYEAAEKVERKKKRDVYVKELAQNVHKVSAAVNAQTGALRETDDANQYLPYNEVNIPASTDWQIVQEFVLRKMTLHDIPAHYLISDPSNLPQESLKYFYIDSNWIDALLDGMLSIGNHLENKDDVVKQAMKNSLNRYFETLYGFSGGDYRPQVPCFGFFLRGAIVKAFPGLEVSAPFPDASEKRQQGILVERIDEDVLLCLFDRMPGSKYWHPEDGIGISSPPHQPCFRLGTELAWHDEANKGEIKLQLRPLYTTTDKVPYEQENRAVSASDAEHRWRSLKPLTYTNVDGVDEHDDPGLSVKRIFDFDNRMLVLPAYGHMCLEFLKREVNKDRAQVYFEADEPTAVLVALQLNANIPALVIKTPAAADSSHPLDTIDTPRQIRLRDTSVTTFEALSMPTVAALQVNTFSMQMQSLAVELPETAISLPKAAPPPDNSLNSDTNDRKVWDTDNKYLETLLNGVEYHLGQREEAQALSRPYLTPPKSLRPGFFTKLVGWVDDTVTGAMGGEVPMADYIPAQYTTDVKMDGETHGDQIVPVDLIFSITFKDFTVRTEKLSHKKWDKPELQLFSLQVDIPLGEGDRKISQMYNGQGAKMLNNQLFTIHTEDVTTEKQGDDHFVRFTLVPRTITRSIPLSRCSDMSFIVNQIVPNAKKGKCIFHVTENYRSRWTKPGDGKESVPATSAITQRADQQVQWRQHQAADSTRMEYGQGWTELFGGLLFALLGTSLLGQFLALSVIGVPLLFLVVKIPMLLVPLIVRAAIWMQTHLWPKIPYILGGSLAVSVIIGVLIAVVSIRKGSASGMVLLWLWGTQLMTLHFAAGLLYGAVMLSSYLIPLIPGVLVWIFYHWPYFALVGLLGLGLWIWKSDEHYVAQAIVVALLAFTVIPSMAPALGGYVVVRLSIALWQWLTPIVSPYLVAFWQYLLLPVSHWFADHWKAIVSVGIATYLTAWYRTSDRGTFYLMAVLAAGALLSTLSGLFIVWVWELIFG